MPRLHDREPLLSGSELRSAERNDALHHFSLSPGGRGARSPHFETHHGESSSRAHHRLAIYPTNTGARKAVRLLIGGFLALLEASPPPCPGGTALRTSFHFSVVSCLSISRSALSGSRPKPSGRRAGG